VQFVAGEKFGRWSGRVVWGVRGAVWGRLVGGGEVLVVVGVVGGGFLEGVMVGEEGSERVEWCTGGSLRVLVLVLGSGSCGWLEGVVGWMGVDGRSVPEISCSAAASRVPVEECVRPIVESEPEESLGFLLRWRGVVGAAGAISPSAAAAVVVVVCVNGVSCWCSSKDGFADGLLSPLFISFASLQRRPSASSA